MASLVRMTLVMALPLSCLSTVSAAPALPQSESDSSWGSISGVVKHVPVPGKSWRYRRYYVQRRSDGELAEAVVALRSRTIAKIAPKAPPREHHIDQVGFQFTPETTVIRRGDTVRFTNSDASLHNVRSDSPLAKFNLNVSQGEQHRQEFPKAGGLRNPVQVGCVYHGSMRAWIFVFDHPWFDLTDKQGSYQLDRIPPGEYDLYVLHPAGSFEHRQKVTVVAGKTLTINVQLPADQDQAPKSSPK